MANNTSNQKYRHLSDFPAVLDDTPPHYRLKKILFSNLMMRRIVNSYEAFRKFEVSRKKTQRSIEKLQHRSQHEYSTADYGYTDELGELRTALDYKKEVERGFPNPGESKQLYNHAELVLSELLDRSRYFVNFGAGYAYIDSILASKFPDIQFIGVDRSKFTKVLNESCFPALTNMEFLAEDVLTFLENKDFENGVFFHTRTCCLLPKSFIELLYKAVAKAGLSHIVCMEQVGISRQTGAPYKFSDNEQPSVAFRWGMYIHNYPEILNKAGYSVTRAELLKTDHPHKDFRILSITACRKEG